MLSRVKCKAQQCQAMPLSMLGARKVFLNCAGTTCGGGPGDYLPSVKEHLVRLSSRWL